MAPHNAQSSSPSRTCLPLVKFSYATVAEGISAPIPWKHISSVSDLSAILDIVDVSGPAGAVERRQQFRVLQGLEILEDIDLDILASEAHRTAVDPQSIPPYSASPLITVIAKLPCVAMRYPLAGGRVRRFQVRFADVEGFHEMMRRLAKACVPVTNAEVAGHHLQTFPGQPIQHTATVAQPSQISNIRQRPATATVYDYTTDIRQKELTGTSQEINQRPATSGRPSIYRQQVPVDWNPYTQQCSQMDQYMAPIAATEKTAVNSSLAETSLWSTQPTDPAIDLYMPRPPFSSAPVAQSRDNEMPPRRELPFTRKPRQVDQNRSTPRPTLPHPCPSDELQPASMPEPVPATTLNSNTEQSVPKSQKRPTSKSAQEPAPKRGRATSTRKKAEPKGRKQSPAPAIEKVPQEITIEPITRTETQTTTSEKPAGKRADSRSKQTNLPECKLSQPTTTVEADGHVQTLQIASLPRALAIDPATPPPITGSDSARDLTAGNLNRSPHEIQSKVFTNPVLSAAFTQPIDETTPGKRTQADEMSLETRRVVETWICEQLRNDEFLDICKMVDSVWARALARF